ncbi:DNA-directed RNA polymerase II subunit RPB1 [Harmonia axyridis]|uniref:DNA-directed RNA polymerase II subunit RPB1 n=1 Tax=Harmonia axyridis TaxID=115357 RepID=UPI001E277007|nr:DNA-directed RNA polymerase II subunit RPB1 [Harmonia axyridis]
MVYLAAILVASVFVVKTAFSSPWNDPTTNQFHIQTDEGPERYFKYQTQNGQYRKEKRLEDGTVIGSYAWIDDDGYLRQRDYIADSQGYRIVKNKNVFVGKNINVGDAVKATKKITNTYIPPAISNRGYVANTPRPILRPSGVAPSVDISLNSIPSSTPSPVTFDSTTYGHIYSSHSNTNEVSTENYSQTSTVRPFTSTTPFSVSRPSSIHIQQNQIPLSTPNELPSSVSYIPPAPTYISPYSPVTNVYSPSSTEPPVNYSPTPEYNLSPPLPDTQKSLAYIPPQNTQPSTTPSPSSIYLPSSTPDYISITPPPRKYIPQPSINTNSIEYSGNPQYEHYPDEFVNPYIHQNGPTYPIDTRGQSFNPVYNNIGNGYDPQYPYYDGISVTNDGFRYYIPKAYHEEQNSGSDTKSGSFGYIDPFGIRRVIYYNAGPDGFKHRKNNRYVGHDATPYDPRPY